jgi:GTP-binding protein Era
MENNNYKSGYIAVIGKPNVGKSTIINNLIGQKLTIVTPKPQTTRDNIIGIHTDKNCQMIFIDTPGIHAPKTLLGKHMVKEARNSLRDADIALFVIEPFGITKEDELVAGVLKEFTKPVFLIVNKSDTKKKNEMLPVIDEVKNWHTFADIIPLSGLKGDNMDLLREKLVQTLPLGPQYYPEDQVSDKQERFFVTEIIRENALRYLQEEVPHSVAVKVEEMKDRSPTLSYIKATIYVERDSQKLIIIGKDGHQIKKIGEESRKKLESFLERKVYLELWVKVSKDWRKNPAVLKELGYT